jgi:hypothetical protein
LLMLTILWRSWRMLSCCWGWVTMLLTRPEAVR